MGAEKPRCDVGVLCSWMLAAVIHEKTFRWQLIEDIATGEEHCVLVVKLPRQRLREVIACPVCGGRPRPELPALPQER